MRGIGCDRRRRSFGIKTCPSNGRFQRLEAQTAYILSIKSRLQALLARHLSIKAMRSIRRGTRQSTPPRRLLRGWWVTVQFPDFYTTFLTSHLARVVAVS